MQSLTGNHKIHTYLFDSVALLR